MGLGRVGQRWGGCFQTGVLCVALTVCEPMQMHTHTANTRTHTDTDTHTDTHADTHRRTQKHRNTQTDAQTHKHTDTDAHTHRRTDTHRHEDTQRHTNTQTHRQAQTHRHTDTQTHKKSAGAQDAGQGLGNLPKHISQSIPQQEKRGIHKKVLHVPRGELGVSGARENCVCPTGMAFRWRRQKRLWMLDQARTMAEDN